MKKVSSHENIIRVFFTNMINSTTFLQQDTSQIPKKIKNLHMS